MSLLALSLSTKNLWPEVRDSSRVCLDAPSLSGEVFLAMLHVHCGGFLFQGMWTVAKWYTQFGLMVGTVFREVLRDLELEGLHEDAAMVRGEQPACAFAFSSFLALSVP